MLEYLRNAADKPVAKILIGILAFSFVGWGVAEWIFGGAIRGQNIASVGGESISIQEFNTEKTRQMAMLDKDMQKKIYTDANAANQFYGAVLGNLVTNKMVENRADDLGFVVSDRRVAREIRQFPEFQENGAFSTRLFDTVLYQSGFSEATFADYLRHQIKRSMTLGAMAVPIKVPDFALRAAYNARHAQRQIDYIPVKFSQFNVGTPTDEQLRQFYAANPVRRPETRAVSYILVAADMTKPDQADRAYELAQRVEDDLIGGASMADMPARHRVKHVSIPAFAVDARPVDRVLDDAMMARVFDMDVGVESELIETKDGYVIIRVDTINPAQIADFDSVKKDLGTAWRRDAQRKQAYVRANELLVALNADGKLPGKKSVTVSRTSGAPTDVLVAAFKGEIGDNSIVPGTDAFYVMHIADDIDPRMDNKKMQAMRPEIQNMMTRGIMDDYNAFLGREYPAKLNHKLLDRVMAK